MVVIGGIIGSGIFINPYIVAQRLDSSVLVLAAWAAGGAIALAGAFAYAELGALFPKAGGQYVYLRDGCHPMLGFLYGWALLLMIESGAIAAVAITFATYALRLLGRPDVAPAPLADRRDRAAVDCQLPRREAGQPGPERLRRPQGRGARDPDRRWSAGARGGRLVGRPPATPPRRRRRSWPFGAALVPILFAYGGWQNANYIAEEIDNPRRNLPLSLLAGTLTVIVDLRVGERGLPARARARGTGRHCDAGVDGCRDHVRLARRPVRHGRDCRVHVRLSRPRDSGADARVLRDGRGSLPVRHSPDCIRSTRRPGSPSWFSLPGRACSRSRGATNSS